MMKIYNLFFSPTGTSARVADAVAEAIAAKLSGELIRVDLTTAGLTEPPVVSPDDIVIVCAPVYGGHMPPVARCRMDMMRGGGAKCVLIAVYGNRAFERALADMAGFAAEHGLTPVAAGAFVGEHSYSTAEHPIAAGRPDAEDLRSAAEFGHRVADKMAAGDAEGIDVASVGDVPAPESSLAGFRSFVTEHMARQKASPQVLLPEVDTAVCTRCGTCVSVCPTQAIADDCHTADAAKCLRCCACVKACPEGARTLRSPFGPVLSAHFSDRKPPVWIL